MKTFSEKELDDFLTNLLIFVLATGFLFLLGTQMGWCATKQTAQADTFNISHTCIKTFVVSKSGKTDKIYAVYKDSKHGVDDLIPVSRTVVQYYYLCDSNGIRPNLGIVVKNGEIRTIVRIRPKVKK